MLEEWENEADHWEQDNLVINRTGATGCLCGYVGVSKSHPFFGKNYSESVDVPESVMNREVDFDKVGLINMLCANGDSEENTLDIVLAIDVHGGITYAREYAPKKEDEDDLWWFGFDCGHYGDLSPAYDGMFSDGVYRNFEYVKNECISMAKQLERFAN